MDMYLAAPRLESLATEVAQAIYRGDWIVAARALGDMSGTIPDLATEVAFEASRAGHTNKVIANALDVPPRALRGLKEVARA